MSVSAPPNNVNQETLRYLVTHPEVIRIALAERSLYHFIQQLWATIEPQQFIGNWHIELMCQYLEKVSLGEIKRLLINIPPRHSKTLVVSVMWPAWTWIKFPSKRFLAASYSHELSKRDSMSCRRVIKSQLYQDRWGDHFQLSREQDTKIRFQNDKGGYRLATSVDGALTGEGGDIILIDDPINSKDAGSEVVREACTSWWDESMSSRLNDPRTGAYVVVMQRLHHEDLTGHLLAKGGWTHLCIPARYEGDGVHPHPCSEDPRTEPNQLLWPERYPEEELHKLEVDLGSYGAAGQLQQRPAPRSGGMFDASWWEIVDAVPSGGTTVRGWDLAATEDKVRKAKVPWTAGVKMTRVRNTFYIEHVVRLRGSSHAVERAIKNTASQDGTHVLIDLPQDPGQAGKAQVRYLVRKLIGYNARFSPESGSKEQRAEALSAQAEARNVKLVRGTWNKNFIEEAALFPNSDYMDQIDAASRAFHRLAKKRRRIGAAIGALIQ